jgi:L-serine dehydratase
MFISVLDLFKLGIGPSSSHTVGPMIAALEFRKNVEAFLSDSKTEGQHFIRCTLRGSLAATGKGHATDHGITFGLHGYHPEQLTKMDVKALIDSLWRPHTLFPDQHSLTFSPEEDIVFNYGRPLKAHPNGMIFALIHATGKTVLSETIFSIGGGFIATEEQLKLTVAPLEMEDSSSCPYPFDTAKMTLEMAKASGLSIAQMKTENELAFISRDELNQGIESIWKAMVSCIEKGLDTEGTLPGVLKVTRRARSLYQQLLKQKTNVDVSEWLCAYAMAVNEENAAGHAVVTAPTNGAAGVIPAVLYYFIKHEGGDIAKVAEFLLTAAAIGGLIKHRSSISGAEVGCQGEVGSADSRAAAGLCAVRGGTPEQIDYAAEIALEHHLGLTCDPVEGLVQVPCIERNGFGAIKAYTAASLALRGSGEHFMPLDSCILAMKKTGEEMSHKYNETALGGLAVSITEC